MSFYTVQVPAAGYELERSAVAHILALGRTRIIASRSARNRWSRGLQRNASAGCSAVGASLPC